MNPLSRLIEANHDWLVRRILRYGAMHGYADAISLPETVWKTAVADMCRELTKALHGRVSAMELTAGADYSRDPVALFGSRVARRHQQQNIPFQTLFGFMKYCRQSFADLVRNGAFEEKPEELYRQMVERFFDRMEMGFLMAWLRNQTGEEIRRMNADLEQRVRERTAQLEALGRDNDKKLREFFFLHRMSNTMLSTIKLNKLSHLILTALTTGAPPFFDRAMLFLVNERSSIMQGMLGVTRQTSATLVDSDVDTEDILAVRWDISEGDMERQRNSEFNCQVKGSRLELSRSRNAASRAALEKKVIFVADTQRERGIDTEFVRSFGIRSCAIAPLMAKERVIGVVVVDNALDGKPITGDDLRFLQLFANQAGMAVERSILYNRLEDANRSLHEAREHLIQGERLSTLGEMATSIAHEIKGPLVSIGGFARRLERRLPPTLKEHDHAATIVREAERLEKMLTDILSFSRKTTICYSFRNIVDILEECLAIASPALDENNIAVHKKYPPSTIGLLGDHQQLKQVFLNLIMNAQEAMRSGGELRIAIAPSRLNGVEAVSVKVGDTGGGIPLESLNSIFNSFFTTKETGTGLGLPIANRIVTNHGGKIQVNNKIGSGVEFTVVLPLKP